MSDIFEKPIPGHHDYSNVYHIPRDEDIEKRSLPDPSNTSAMSRSTHSLATQVRILAVAVVVTIVLLMVTIGVVVFVMTRVKQLESSEISSTLRVEGNENADSTDETSANSCFTNTNTSDGNLVMFSTMKTSNEDVVDGKNLIFTLVVDNLGGGYDKNTGIFTAPYPGTYLFHTTVCARLGKWVYVHLMGRWISLATVGVLSNDGTGSCTSATAIVLLSAGDQAWVEGAWSVSEALYHADSYSLPTFTGTLLQRVGP